MNGECDPSAGASSARTIVNTATKVTATIRLATVSPGLRALRREPRADRVSFAGCSRLKRLGSGLAARLRQLDDFAGVRLVAVTGFGQPGDRERALAAGFDRHLVKPVDLKSLIHVIEELRTEMTGVPPLGR